MQTKKVNTMFKNNFSILLLSCLLCIQVTEARGTDSRAHFMQVHLVLVLRIIISIIIIN